MTAPDPLDAYLSSGGDKITGLSFYDGPNGYIFVGFREGLSADILRNNGNKKHPGNGSYQTDVRFEPLGQRFFKETFTVKDSAGNFSHTKIILSPKGLVGITILGDPDCIDVRR